MKLVVFGANGQTGRLPTSHALAAGHRVVAVTRHPRDLPVVGPGLTVAGVDVRDEAAVGDASSASRSRPGPFPTASPSRRHGMNQRKDHP
jgi:putative NADH-flavin reductase